MANTTHVQVVESLYAAFQSGDTAAVLACVADDVVFTIPEMPGVPLRPSYHGKHGVSDFLSDREPLIRYTLFEPHKFFSDQDTVLVLGGTAGIVVHSQAPFRYRWVQLFEFTPDNRIQRFHEFLDTQVLVSAFAAQT
jgi:ketosteroid isomerase-like protein